MFTFALYQILGHDRVYRLFMTWDDFNEVIAKYLVKLDWELL